jgi:hypothetical protein
LGKDLRLEVRRIRYGASRDRPRDVAWLDCAAPHEHLVVDGTVTSARTNSSIPVVWALLPLSRSLATGSQQAMVDVDRRTLHPPWARLPLNMCMTIITLLLLRTGVTWLLRRLILMIAWPFCWQIDVSQAWVQWTLAFYGLKVMPA